MSDENFEILPRREKANQNIVAWAYKSAVDAAIYKDWRDCRLPDMIITTVVMAGFYLGAMGVMYLVARQTDTTSEFEATLTTVPSVIEAGLVYLFLVYIAPAVLTFVVIYKTGRWLWTDLLRGD